MKRISIRSFLTPLALVFISISASAQWGVGIRNNRFVYGDFTFSKHYELKLEESVFSEGIGYQYLRGYAAYKGGIKNVAYKISGYYGSTYNRSYYSTGALMELRCRLGKYFLFDGKLNPHYDSGYGYKTCFYAGAGVAVSRTIGITAGYNTIPEYRMMEKRVHAGLDFHVKQLSVRPTLSLPVEKDNFEKNIRVLMNFDYTFGR